MVDPEIEDSSTTFVDSPEDSEEFVTDAPKGGIVRKPERTTGDRSYDGYRTHHPPVDDILEYRTLYNQGPHVGDSVEITLDWLLADSWNVSARNIAKSDAAMDPAEVAQLRQLLVNSDFDRIFHDWVERAAVEGHGFMELVVDDTSKFRPRLLPYERVHKFTDEYGEVQEYILEPPEGGGPTAQDATVYDKHQVAEIYLRKAPLEHFGHSLIERGKEQADMLRDMEIDYARFVASKAYPPILWKCGTSDSQWTEEQMEGWLEDVQQIEPDSMIAGPHDVEAEAVGTTSTSASAGAMRLEETFKHHERRVVTSIGVPAVLANMDSQGSSAESVMPAFKRRIRRYQMLVKEAVEHQIIKPLFVQAVKGQDEVAEYEGLLPVFEFGEHSSAEERLEIDKLIKLFNNGMLTREAFAKRAGIDPETELPSMDNLNNEVVPTLQALSTDGQGVRGVGDAIQNPDGGRPTDTDGGAQSSGREAIRREEGSGDNSDPEDRPQQSPTEDVS
jgi:hypothetical protein